MSAKNKPSDKMQADGNKLLEMRGNQSRIAPDAKLESVYQTQAISEIDRMEKNVPLAGDASVAQERDWSIENHK